MAEAIAATSKQRPNQAKELAALAGILPKARLLPPLHSSRFAHGQKHFELFAYLSDHLVLRFAYVAQRRAQFSEGDHCETQPCGKG